MLLSTVALLSERHFDGPHWWFVFFPLIPLFWITVFILVVSLIRRRVGGPWRGHGSSPEAVLGERYARGEIDETEYRSRLEVLRSGRR
jgi:putative membrane protein